MNKNAYNNMNLIMENWRRFAAEIKDDEDFDLLKESKMYIKKTSKQLSESKNKNPYAEVMTFGDFITKVENKKIKLNEAQKIYFDTLDHDGQKLNELSISDVGSAIKKGAKRVASGVAKVGTAVAKQLWEFLKKMFFGAISMVGSFLTGVAKAFTNPKATAAAIFNKENLAKVVNILKTIPGKVLQYVKDNKWKIVASVALTVLLVVVGLVFFKMSVVAAYPVARAVQGCGGAAVGVAKAVKGAAVAGALEEGAFAVGICKMVSGVTVQTINRLVADKANVDALIGVLAENEKTMQRSYELVSKETAGVDASGAEYSTETVEYKELSDHAVAVKIKTIELLDMYRRGAIPIGTFKRLAAGDSEVEATINKAIEGLVNNKCSDPDHHQALISLGQQVKVLYGGNIRAELTQYMQQSGTESIESVVSEMKSEGLITVSLGS